MAYDENRATVTLPSTEAQGLQENLRSKGLSTTAVALHGRFHWAGNSQLLETLLDFCSSDARFQFPDAAHSLVPTRSNSSGQQILSGSLSQEALFAILVTPAQWHQAFTLVKSEVLSRTDSLVVAFGTPCIPPSFLRAQDINIFSVSELQDMTSATGTKRSRSKYGFLDTDIAVVGMSCKAPGASNLEEFWDLLCEGRSQHKQVPSDRFGFETGHRQVDAKRKWFGNFIDDHDTFDHKFFKKSPRECASQDPQQRQLLQVAYQAVEQSGYFHSQAMQADSHVGCYVGVCAVDYENNVACHAPTAFTATGNLRGFIAGKVSHYFGWTGPGLTIDTACSSSAVAVHQACQSILSGECNAALAAGTHVMTNPLWYQNLAGASFLSTTGACKPFDEKADGYCRGEAVAAVFLKSMSQAVADGDQILGTIAATAVQQNDNSTPIFVPNPDSLSSLFDIATRRAGIDPHQIGVVEAHGTGTPVGDPAEYSSVRKVLAGKARSSKLLLSSVKGLIGHSECTSGLMSLIKTLLIIMKGKMPPQASFEKLSPGLKASPEDQIVVPTTLTPWTPVYRAALINNYGASGSNASIIVSQAPIQGPLSYRQKTSDQLNTKLPFWFSGLDDNSLRHYASALVRYLRSQEGQNTSFRDIAFSNSRQSNHGLDRGLIMACNSKADLQDRLTTFSNGDGSDCTVPKSAKRPLVLSFGGQISAFIGLDRAVYESAGILRKHLGSCNAVCLAHRLPSIFPDIFKRKPITDPVKLQTMLFAMQYSCAKSWIDCGVKPAALVGHSFGELTALAVAGVLSLEDALEMVAGRAKVVRDYWGPEKGAMMAVEGDADHVSALLQECNAEIGNEAPAVIGCFNGPRTFTLSGSRRAIEAVEDALSKQSVHHIKHKRLEVTNAFHSPLIDPLMSRLEASAEGLEFKQPCIHLERSTKQPFTEAYTARFVAEHMRGPVFFNDAVTRINEQYPSSIWLEAGSASTVTNMVCRALGSPKDSLFQGINITNDSGMNNLSDATANLWKVGLDVSFWPHHHLQVSAYSPVLLPPYQFEKVRHWLELKAPVAQETSSDNAVAQEVAKPPDTLLTFLGNRDGKRRSQFRINTNIAKYEALVEGHIIAQTASICPATVQLDLAIESLRLLEPKLISEGFDPQVANVVNSAPLCRDPARTTILELVHSKGHDHAWTFEISSTIEGNNAARTSHTSGEIVLKHIDDPQLKADFAQYERLSTHKRCLALLESTTAEDVIQGRNIYKAFGPVVDYGPEYQGLKKLVGDTAASAGRVVKKYNGLTWFDAHLADCFAQVGGIWVNCMTDHDPSDIYIANGIEKWVRSPNLTSGNRSGSWDVAAYHHGPVGKSYMTDIFVFDAVSGALVEVILGINYVRVPKLYMSKLLSRLAKVAVKDAITGSGAAATSTDQIEQPLALSKEQPRLSRQPVTRLRREQPTKIKTNYIDKVKAILADLAGLEVDEINDDSELANLGIDSLVGMEMAKEIENHLQCTLPNQDLMLVTDVSSLMSCVGSALGECDTDSVDGSLTSDEGYQSHSSGAVTPKEKPPSSVGSLGVDLKPFLAAFIGVEISDIKSGVVLRDMGLDSLLAMELRPDLESKCSITIDEHVIIEDQDIDGLERLCGGMAQGAGRLEPTTSIPLEPAAQPLKNTKPDVSKSHCLELPGDMVAQAFYETKIRTDDLIKEYGLDVYAHQTGPDQTRLCILLTIEALEDLGCSLRKANPGDKLVKVLSAPEHTRFVDYLYKMVATESDLITEEGDHFVRTDRPIPLQTSKDLLEELNRKWPNEQHCNDLTYYAGSHLPQVLGGKTDGVKLIFGSSRGRDLVSKVYGDWPMNKLYYRQMQDFISRLISRLPSDGAPLKILEMGAGTGGTTKWLLPLLASLDYPIEYTFTDLGPSFIAAARKQFKQYSFMKFRTHDIEKEPAEDLVGTQHIVIASNAVHATHSLVNSTGNIRKMLRSDGLLMMLEMTSTMYWCDMIFGLFEGWWFFGDGRSHAVTNETQWKTALQSAGYGHVDWTDGTRPENKLERLLIAMASESRYDTNPHPITPPSKSTTDILFRKTAVEGYVQQMTHHFEKPVQVTSRPRTSGKCVLLTGATGSLGSHLLACLAEDRSVDKIICLNRRGRASTPKTRQEKAMKDKDISIASSAWGKVEVIESSASKQLLGLSADDYAYLTENVTHIVHNAWLMNAKIPLKGFEGQFEIMKNLIDLAHAISCGRQSGFRVTFEFVSSIAVVGHYPEWKNNVNAPEERMPIEAVLENGYGDAKYVCELMLDHTLHKYPDCFKATSVRIGQIAGSKKTGYWNPMEHLSFLWKSSQTINALPAFEGSLSWTSVDDVAGTLRDLLLVEQPHPVYHIDNPVRQEWKTMIPVLANALDIPHSNVVPFERWIERVRACTNLPEKENPAIYLIDFLDDNFLRMSCGGLLLSTEKSMEHSRTLRAVGPVSKETVLLFVKSWKDTKFLS